MTLPAIDASGAYTFQSSVTNATAFALTGFNTTSPGDEIVVAISTVSTSLDAVASVTSPGLTFTKIGSVAGVTGAYSGSTYYFNTEIWSAPATGALSNATITVNLNANLAGVSNRQGMCIVAFGVSNWGSLDTYSGLPIENYSASTTTSGQAYSTTNPGLAIMVQLLTGDTSGGTVGNKFIDSSGYFGGMGVYSASNSSAASGSTNLNQTGLTTTGAQWIIFAVDAPVTNINLGGAVGSYSMSGDTGALLEAHMLGTAPGSYAISGDAALLRQLYALDAAVGFYTIAGDTAALLEAHRLAAAAGSYAVTGDSAALLEAHRLMGSVGVYAISGDAASLAIGLVLQPVVGSYLVTGDSAALLHRYVVNGAVGNYAISGDPAALLRTRIANLASGDYEIVGSPSVIVFQFPLELGSYAISGADASLSIEVALDLDVGVYQIMGLPASLEQSTLYVYADPGVYLIDGAAATFGLMMPMESGSYFISGEDAKLLWGYIISGGGGPAATNYVVLQPSGEYCMHGRSARMLYYPVRPPPIDEQGRGGGGIPPKETPRDREIYELFRNNAHNREIEAGVPPHPIAAQNLTTPFFPASRPSFVRPPPKGKPK